MLDRVAAPEQQARPAAVARRAPLSCCRRAPAALTALAAAWAVTGARPPRPRPTWCCPPSSSRPPRACCAPAGTPRPACDRGRARVRSAALVGGLLFSVWPWGLHPVPVAGFAFTLLVAAAWALRLADPADPGVRRPTSRSPAPDSPRG
ncbi:hypothetical protein ACU686_23810 [Yinghuangia aomiensis]